MERTLVLLKPDALQRGLMGEILGRFERKGLKVVGLKMMQLSDALLDEHYVHLTHLPFFAEIKQFMMRTPVVALCLEGVGAVDAVRGMCGKTLAREALPGTIRGDLGMSIQANLVHASDGPEAAAAEVPRFFNEGELFDYTWLPLDYTYTTKEQSGS
jgi:nucleoside-diphosphate kinase